MGLIPYMLHYIQTNSWISYTVINNGLLFHILFPKNAIVKWYDITCNTALIVYVNIYASDPFVFLWSCIACTCFIWNQVYIKHELFKAFIHVICVQGFLFKALELSEV